MTRSPSGLVPILATPFDERGNLDLPSLRRLVEFQLGCGVDGVATLGMASEAFALTTAERRQVLTTVVEVVGGAVPVVAGVNGTSTATAVEQSLEAAEAGATTLMVLPPFMVKPGPAQLVEFYGQVASATDVPVMVQDAPGPTGVTMSADLIGQLSRLPGVSSVKVEAPPTALKVTAVRKVVDPSFAVLGGQNAQFVLDEYARGAIGTMPACEFADLLAPVLADVAAGRLADARAGFGALLPLVLFGLQPGVAWAVHKEVLVRRGVIAAATVRLPASPLDAPTRAALTTVLDDLGLPPAVVAGG
jgi:2-keto-3-deoxy-L-arabinonate dehydratase